MTRIVLQADGSSTAPAPTRPTPTSPSRTAASSRSAPGSTATRWSTSAGRTPSSRAVRLPHPRDASRRRPVGRVQTPFSLPVLRGGRNLRTTLEAGITIGPRRRRGRPRDQDARRARPVRRPADADLDLDAQPDRRPRRRLVSVGRRVPFMPRHPGRPSGIVDGPDEIRRKVRELHRAGADVIKVATSRRRAVAARRSPPRPLPAGRARRARRGGDRGRHVGHGPRPGRRRDQERRPGRRPLDRAWDLPRRRGDRADARPRDLVRPDAGRPAGRARRRRRRDRLPPAVVDKARDGPRHPPRRRSGRRSRPASGSRWAPTPASRRTATTCASSR